MCNSKYIIKFSGSTTKIEYLEIKYLDISLYWYISIILLEIHSQAISLTYINS